MGLLFRGHRQIQDSQTTVERKLGLATLFVHVYFEDVGWFAFCGSDMDKNQHCATAGMLIFQARVSGKS